MAIKIKRIIPIKSGALLKRTGEIPAICIAVNSKFFANPPNAITVPNNAINGAS